MAEHVPSVVGYYCASCALLLLANPANGLRINAVAMDLADDALREVLTSARDHKSTGWAQP